MRFERVSIPAVDPDALSDWYARTLGVETTGDGGDSDAASVELGATTLEFQPVAESASQHLALRTPADIDALAAWLAERATIHPVEVPNPGGSSFSTPTPSTSPTARATSSNASATTATRPSHSRAGCR